MRKVAKVIIHIIIGALAVCGILAIVFVYFAFDPSDLFNSSDDDNPYTEEEYERLAEEGGFEDIDNYRGTPYEYEYVYITPTGHCYHTIDCEYLENTLYVKPYVLGQTPDGYTECPKCEPWQWE